MSQLTESELEEIRLLIEQDKKARYAAAYVRQILLYIAGVIGAIGIIWAAFRDLVRVSGSS